MKLLICRLIAINISILLLSGCASSNKTAKSKIKIKGDEIVIFENNILRDPASNYVWSYFEDNPTTYFRFKLSSSNSISGLPSAEQIVELLRKVSYQLNSKRYHGNVAETQWFNNDCDFLTSSSTRTNEGEILYEVVHWDTRTRSSSKHLATGGDLVVVLFLNEN